MGHSTVQNTVNPKVTVAQTPLSFIATFDGAATHGHFADISADAAIEKMLRCYEAQADASERRAAEEAESAVKLCETVAAIRKAVEAGEIVYVTEHP